MHVIEDGELCALLRAFSPGRMEPYVRFADGRLDLAFRLYAWNVEMSAAFAGPLHCLEVVLRNAMHRALTDCVGREDWWNHQRIKLHRIAVLAVRDAAEKLRRLDKEITADRIVAELPSASGLPCSAREQTTRRNCGGLPFVPHSRRTAASARRSMRSWKRCDGSGTASPTSAVWPIVVGTVTACDSPGHGI
ncbi:MAG TPA: hypothetical protein VGR06_13640 [Actinophytocola sp.]|uniref:hypothetical protein n=1 Tax=Actinophytocola sp. TaxID=1872138 RepID=UPI002E0CE28F|nr:hypothetical protein [Actinophytocola sp.]